MGDNGRGAVLPNSFLNGAHRAILGMSCVHVLDAQLLMLFCDCESLVKENYDYYY